MTLEQYKTELLEKLDAADFLHVRDKDGPAYQVLVAASRDPNLKTGDWTQLSNLFYGYRK